MPAPKPQTLLSVLALALAIPAAAGADDPSFPTLEELRQQHEDRIESLGPPSYQAADPQAAVVTPGTLLENDRFWPYQVVLTEPLAPRGGSSVALRPGLRGVVVRYQPDGNVRIDFGRDGVVEVPLAKTDLVERVNRVRLGEERKISPNLTHAIGPRLVTTIDPAGPGTIPFEETFAARGYLAVFANPREEGFDELAEALAHADLHGRHGVWTVLLPTVAQGQLPSLETHQRLHRAGWIVLFVHEAFALSYARSLRDEDEPAPALMLSTADGRLLLDRPFGAGALDEIEAALEAEFGATRVAGQETP